MPALYADTTGSAGIVKDLNFGNVDPQFVDAANGNFALKLSSPAFASGDPNTEIAGSIISDDLAATDISYVPLKGLQGSSESTFADGTAEISTNSRVTVRSGNVKIVNPSLGAHEPSLDTNFKPVTSPPVGQISYINADGSAGAPVTIGIDPEGSTITTIIPADQIEDVNINTDVELSFETDGAVIESDGNIRLDEVININNATPGTIQIVIVSSGPVDYAQLTDSPPVSDSGEDLCNERLRRLGLCPDDPCPNKPPLIGLDYNLNTLVCISLQYRRNVINVPYGPGVAWQQGPPSIRLRGKNVYRVMNNSPSGEYIK